MNILIVGANGKIARHLIKILAEEKDYHITAMIRKEEQAAELKELGADETIVSNLEGDISSVFEAQEAVVFAAGSGGHTGADKTILIDLWGARKAVDAAKEYGARRFLMVGSMRSSNPDEGPDSMKHYFVAKKLADEYLQHSGLNYTIVRPGRLTDHTPSGKVRIAPALGELGEVTRTDIAEVLARSIKAETTFFKAFDVIDGDTDIEKAIRSI